MSSNRATCSTARVSVTVTDFLEAGRGPSQAEVELTDTGHGAVSQGRANDPIVVVGEAYLEFSVSPREGDRYGYSPVGISFREVGGEGAEAESRHRDRDPLGHAAFPLRAFASRGDTMQLTLFDANPEPGEFKFDIVIQRSDGLLGIIDPRIRNRGVFM